MAHYGIMHENQKSARCLTCGAPLPGAARFDPQEGVMTGPEVYCSIHCEHYAGLQRASAATTVSAFDSDDDHHGFDE